MYNLSTSLTTPKSYILSTMPANFLSFLTWSNGFQLASPFSVYCLMTKRKGSETWLLGFKPWLKFTCWVLKYVTCFCLSFLIYKIETVLLLSGSFYEVKKEFMQCRDLSVVVHVLWNVHLLCTDTVLQLSVAYMIKSPNLVVFGLQ